MSFLEKFRGRSQKDNEPFEPNKIQGEILNVAAQWKMDGTPWWRGFAMSNYLNEERGVWVGPGTLYKNLHILRDNGALESIFGGSNSSIKPLAQIPPIIIEDGTAEDGGIACYYQITGEGNKMRGRVDNAQNVMNPGIPQQVPES